MPRPRTTPAAPRTDKGLQLRRPWQERIILEIDPTRKEKIWLRCETKKKCTGAWYEVAPMDLNEATVDLQLEKGQDGLPQLMYSVRAATIPYCCPMCTSSANGSTSETPAIACEWCQHKLSQLRTALKEAEESGNLDPDEVVSQAESILNEQGGSRITEQAAQEILQLMLATEDDDEQAQLPRCIEALHDEGSWADDPDFKDQVAAGFDLPPGTQLHLRTKARQPTSVYKVLKCQCPCGAAIEHDRNVEFGAGSKQPGPLFRHYAATMDGPDGLPVFVCRYDRLKTLYERTIYLATDHGGGGAGSGAGGSSRSKGKRGGSGGASTPHSVVCYPTEAMARLWQDMCNSPDYKLLYKVAIKVHTQLAQEIRNGTALENVFLPGAVSAEQMQQLRAYADFVLLEPRKRKRSGAASCSAGGRGAGSSRQPRQPEEDDAAMMHDDERTDAGDDDGEDGGVGAAGGEEEEYGGEWAADEPGGDGAGPSGTAAAVSQPPASKRTRREQSRLSLQHASSVAASNGNGAGSTSGQGHGQMADVGSGDDRDGTSDDVDAAATAALEQLADAALLRGGSPGRAPPQQQQQPGTGVGDDAPGAGLSHQAVAAGAQAAKEGGSGADVASQSALPGGAVCIPRSTVLSHHGQAAPRPVPAAPSAPMHEVPAAAAAPGHAPDVTDSTAAAVAGPGAACVPGCGVSDACDGCADGTGGAAAGGVTQACGASDAAADAHGQPHSTTQLLRRLLPASPRQHDADDGAGAMHDACRSPQRHRDGPSPEQQLAAAATLQRLLGRRPSLCGGSNQPDGVADAPAPAATAAAVDAAAQPSSPPGCCPAQQQPQQQHAAGDPNDIIAAYAVMYAPSGYEALRAMGCGKRHRLDAADGVCSGAADLLLPCSSKQLRATAAEAVATPHDAGPWGGAPDFATEPSGVLCGRARAAHAHALRQQQGGGVAGLAALEEADAAPEPHAPAASSASRESTAAELPPQAAAPQHLHHHRYRWHCNGLVPDSVTGGPSRPATQLEGDTGPGSAARDTWPGSAARDTGPGSAARDTGPGSAARDRGPGSAARDRGPGSAATAIAGAAIGAEPTAAAPGGLMFVGGSSPPAEAAPARAAPHGAAAALASDEVALLRAHVARIQRSHAAQIAGLSRALREVEARHERLEAVLGAQFDVRVDAALRAAVDARVTQAMQRMAPALAHDLASSVQNYVQEAVEKALRRECDGRGSGSGGAGDQGRGPGA